MPRGAKCYETLVGCFAEDVDGNDLAATHWFELRRSGGAWSTFQEGVVGGTDSLHRAVCSCAMDGSGNIARSPIDCTSSAQVSHHGSLNSPVV